VQNISVKNVLNFYVTHLGRGGYGEGYPNWN